jgi:tellurite resistance protein TerC
MVEWWAWAAVVGFILGVLAFDLLVFHRDPHEVTTREAAMWSAVWIGLGLAFAGVVWLTLGRTAAGEYLGGYLIEKSLSVDNLFVFALLFSYFKVPAAFQHRVLFWGVLGALVSRALFIAGGAALIDNFHWTIFVFGGFLVVTGVKMARRGETTVHPDRNRVLRLLRRATPMTADYAGQRFFVRDAGRRVATPLLAVLVVVETTDILFAVDSIPAIFAVTTNTFLIFTSNAFAILGLRALYFLLAGMIGRFAYLRLGLAAVLVFVGVKMLISDVYKLPIWTSSAVIAALIGGSVVASMRPIGCRGRPVAHTRGAPSDTSRSLCRGALRQMQNNTFKTFVLLGGLGGPFVLAGSLFGRGGAIIGLVLGLGIVGFSYWKSDRLAIRAARAVLVTEAEMPE